MPLVGWDHLELWVGNAKQAAYFYEHALGFTRTAYAGPETGVRDRASYVLEQGDIRLVAHERRSREDTEIARFARGTATASKDIALHRPRRDRGLPPGGAARGARRRASRAGRGRARRASSSRRSRPTATRPHVRRPRRVRRAPFSPATSRARRTADARRRRPASIDHVVGNVELGRHGRLGRVLRARRSG